MLPLVAGAFFVAADAQGSDKPNIEPTEKERQGFSSRSDQATVEAFWRFQFSQNLAIPPSVQLPIDPALNPVRDKVWVWGWRFRLSF